MRPALVMSVTLPLLLATCPTRAHQALPAISAGLAPTASASFTDAAVGLTSAQASRFKSALDALAAQGHACIIAEDAPLHPSLAPGKAPSVPDHIPLSQAVTMVANAYDYDVARAGNVFTLTKRYTDPADLPDVTAEECAEDMHNVALALAAFDPPADWAGTGTHPFRDQIAAILGALPPAQRLAVFSQAGVPVTALDGGARMAVDRWNLGMYLDNDVMMAGALEKEISFAAQASVGMSSLTLTGVPGAPSGTMTLTAFGRREPDGQGGTRFVPLAPSSGSVTDGGQWGDSGGPVTAADQAAARARAAARGADGHETLAAAVAALAGRGTRCEVAPALAAKAVTVAGDVAAAPDAVLAGLARAYGLRVRLRHSDDVTVLDLPERVVPSDVAEVGRTALSLLPAPLLRASRLPDVSATRAKMDEGLQRLQDMSRQGRRDDPAYLALAAERRRLIVQNKDAGAALPAVRFAAVRALRVAVEVAPATAKVDGLLPMAAMKPEERAAYTTALMLFFLDQLRAAFDPTPATQITDEDHFVLTALVYAQPDSRGRWKVDMYLNKMMPDGRWHPDAGMGQVEYDGALPPTAAPSQAAALGFTPLAP